MWRASSSARSSTRSSSLLDNKNAVAIPVFQAPNSNALQLSDAVRKTMAELKKDFPQGVDYTHRLRPDGLRAPVDRGGGAHAARGGALVVLVVILFLQTWRASIIPLVAVPVSIIGTFAVLLAFGFSINTLSLFGLVLAIGIVVDDAIVVVENVERHIASGQTPLEATKSAMAEVSRPIIAITLVLCAVFVPVAFVSGLTGEFYRQFALTIAISTVISAFNSLTLSPALAAVLLKPHGAKHDALTRVMDRLLRRLLQALQPRLRAAGNALLRVPTTHYRAPHGHRADRLRRADRAHLLRLQRGPGRLHPRSGQAIPDRDRAAAAGRHARAHGRGDPQDRRDRPEEARRRACRAVHAACRSTASRRARAPASTSSRWMTSTSARPRTCRRRRLRRR